MNLRGCRGWSNEGSGDCMISYHCCCFLKEEEKYVSSPYSKLPTPSSPGRCYVYLSHAGALSVRAFTQEIGWSALTISGDFSHLGKFDYFGLALGAKAYP